MWSFTERNMVASRVTDTQTGEHFDGLNRQARQQVRTNEGMQEGLSRSAARRRARQNSDLLHRETALERQTRRNVLGSDQQTARGLMETAIQEEGSMPRRMASSCAEQQAYQGWYESLGENANEVPLPPTATRVVSIRMSPEEMMTIERCNNCCSFTFEMGKCPTDRCAPTPLEPSNVYHANINWNSKMTQISNLTIIVGSQLTGREQSKFSVTTLMSAGERAES